MLFHHFNILKMELGLAFLSGQNLFCSPFKESIWQELMYRKNEKKKKTDIKHYKMWIEWLEGNLQLLLTRDIHEGGKQQRA